MSTQSGFSLVEVLVAISILLIAITGPMKILTSSNHSTEFATEQVNAWFLAQEGLELVQKGRDDLLLKYFLNQINGSGGTTTPFAQFQSDYRLCMSTGTKKCGLMISSNANGSVGIRDCATVSCRLYLDTANNVRPSYVHTAAPTGSQTITPYTRTIELGLDPGNPKEIIATSTVTWRTGSFIVDQQVQAVTRLFNIYDTP